MGLWAPFAIRRDGPIQKTGYTGNLEGPKAGGVYHSAEGYLPGMMAELDKLTRSASWTFSNPRNGPLLQHYDLHDHTWANGSIEANIRFFSVEDEGVADEPLTPSQVSNLVDLTVWAWDVEQWPRLKRNEQLWEHNEMTVFGAPPTACPSGRIPWDAIQARSIAYMAKLEQLEQAVEDLEKAALKTAKETKRWRGLTEFVVALHQERLNKQATWNATTEATVAALHPEGAPE